MKNLRYIFSLLSLIAFAACDNGDEQIIDPEAPLPKVSFNISAEVPDSRTALLQDDNGNYRAYWKDGDPIFALEIADSTPSIASGNISGDALSTSFTVTFSGKSASEYIYMFACPNININSTATYLYLKLPTEQSPAAMTTFDGAADILLSNAVVRTTQPSGETIPFEVSRLSSIGKVTVKNLALAEGDKVKSVTFSASKPLTGELTNIMVADIVAEKDPLTNSAFAVAHNSVKVTLPETQSGDFTYFMSCWPTTLSAGEQYTVTVQTEQDTFTKTATLPSNLAFLQGEMTSFTVNMAGIAPGGSGSGDSNAIPNNEIHYTSTDGKVVTPYKTDVFGANIVSNTYSNGHGVITFDGNVTKIGNYAFENCSTLSSVTLPQTITSLGSYTFYRCTAMTTINIPNSVTSIGNDAFYSCDGLTSVTIPDSVTKIGNFAFDYCSNITCVTIGNGVTSMGYGVFSYCTKLSEFNGKFATSDKRCLVVDGVLKAFAPADLTSYDITDGVTRIDNYTFSYCHNLTSISIPNSVTSIGNHAFAWCSRLKTISLPNSITAIEDSAFWDNSALTEITIPDSVTQFGTSILGACESLTAINSKYSTADHRAMIVDGKLIAFAPYGLTSYTIPDSVTSIEKSTFSYCYDLASVTISNSVTAIGNNAFSYCTALTKVTIPQSVTTISNYAFYYCTSLAKVICKPTTPPTLGQYAFQYSNNGYQNIGCKIYVPAASVDAYKAATNWSEYADAIVADEGSSDEPSNAVVATVAQFLDAAEDDTLYELTGVISNVTNTTYGNFDLTDQTGTVLIYGLSSPSGENKYWAASGAKAGDTITVRTVRTSYNGTPEGKDAIFVKLVPGEGGGNEPTPEPAEGAYASDVAFVCAADDSTNAVYSLGDTNIGGQAATGFKLGKSKQQGKFTSQAVGVSGSKYLNFYAGAWKGTTATLYFRVDGGATQSVALANNDGATGNPPYTALTLTKSNHYSVKLDGLTESSTIEFSTNADFALSTHSGSSPDIAPRAIVCGIKLTDEPVDTENPGGTTPDPTQIYYTSSDGNIVTPYKTDVFGANIVSNTYENGQGVITFDGQVTTIGVNAFRNRETLKTIEIPEGVEEIGYQAFEVCSSLESITIPTTLKSFGSVAFNACEQLKSVHISDLTAWCKITPTTGDCNPLSYGADLYLNGSKVTNLTIPSEITTINNMAFYGCGSLMSVTIPSHVTNISWSAFYGCQNIAQLTIEEGVTTIESYAFANCSKLKSVTIPDSVSRLGEAVFSRCNSLTEINCRYSTADKRCLLWNSTLNSFAPADLTSYDIPDSVTAIGSDAFYGYSNLTSISIPEGVTSIGNSAFFNCDALTNVTLPQSVTYIYMAAFNSCNKLESVTIGANVGTIEDYAFNSCNKLTTVYCNATTPPTLGGTSVFDGNASGRKIYVPSSAVSAYKSAQYWSEYNIIGYGGNTGLYIHGASTDFESANVAEAMEYVEEDVFSITAFFAQSQNNEILISKERSATYPFYALAANGEVVTITTPETTYTPLEIEANGLRKLTVNLNTLTWSWERITNQFAMPDSELPNYPTKAYIARDGSMKVWMTRHMAWDGGNIHPKLGSGMVKHTGNGTAGTGGYVAAEFPTFWNDATRINPAYETVESGLGNLETYSDDGRIYTYHEMLGYDARFGIGYARYENGPWVTGEQITDARGVTYTIATVSKTANDYTGDNATDEANNPIFRVQAQGICPYGWHVANASDWLDLFYAMGKASETGTHTYPVKTSDCTYKQMINGGVPNINGWLRNTKDWGTDYIDEGADEFGFNYYPLGYRYMTQGFQNWSMRAQVWVPLPMAGSKPTDYPSAGGGRINMVIKDNKTMTAALANLDIGQAVLPFRCVKNYK